MDTSATETAGLVTVPVSATEAAPIIKARRRKVRSVFVAGHRSYMNWMQARAVPRIEEADLVVLPGGADVSPHLYHQPRHHSTMSDPQADQFEVYVFNKARSLGKPIWGTCRGAQLICALSGGILVQDQRNPSFLHEIELEGGARLVVSSTHHQAQYPWVMQPGQFRLLGWSRDQSAYHSGGNDEELVLGDKEEITGAREVELCHYPESRAIGCQPHPEMLYDRGGYPDTITYFRSLLDRFLDSGGRSVD